MGPEDLAKRANAEGYEHEAEIAHTWAVASALVEKFIGSRVVPDAIRDEAILQVGLGLLDRNGGTSSENDGQYASESPARGSNYDPLRPAYGILRRWVVSF